MGSCLDQDNPSPMKTILILCAYATFLHSLSGRTLFIETQTNGEVTPARVQLRTKCQVRKLSTVHTRIFAFLGAATSGVSRTALAVRGGAPTARFRHCWQ